MNSITDNKELWRTIKPFLSGKITAQTKKLLFKKGKLLSNETEVAETFSKFCENALNKIDINKDANFNDETVLSTKYDTLKTFQLVV